MSISYVTSNTVTERLKRLPTDCHKGTNGTLNIVAGCERFRGAADLCVGGALRTGCGIIRLISEEKVISLVASRHPSCTFALAESTDEIKSVINGISSKVFLVGCGIGRTERSATAVFSVLANAEKAVLDADALNILSANPQMLFQIKGHIITPHVMEFSRLTGLSPAEIKNDPQKHALNFSEKYGCVTVLKDSVTVICAPNGNIYISEHASEGLSKGGSGDVLAGIIGGILAQGYTAEDAAVIGVALHAYASQLCAKELGKRGMLPSDLEIYVAKLLNSLGY